ncbi:NAD-dependent epimerase/dehydratase family protein, partial [Alphaproteobacteria bacterium]|nr:NAD-dependent epimerase/dehydratase family protein [Alphaproteobacteria bacterium]
MDEKIYIAGHTGMVGSAVHRALLANGSGPRIVTCDHAKVDLRDAKATENFFQKHAITQVYVCAAQVGGILANNSRPYDFIFNNISIQLSIMQAALENGVKKLLFLGSSCIYPKECPQPMKEKHLLSGYLEASNEPYAIAKIAGIKLCESINRQFHNDGFDFRALMPTNLYGPGDNYHPTDSHVIAALIRKFIFAKRNSLPVVSVWGS